MANLILLLGLLPITVNVAFCRSTPLLEDSKNAMGTIVHGDDKKDVVRNTGTICPPDGKLCWTCHASTYAECLSQGSYMYCPSTKQACGRKQMPNSGGVWFGCLNSAECRPNVVIKRSRHLVDCNLDVHGDGNCSRPGSACITTNDYGNPCKEKGDDQILHCWQCKHALDEDTCRQQGQWQACHQQHAICTTTKERGRITRGCGDKLKCHPDANGKEVCCDGRCQSCHYEADYAHCNPPYQRCYCRGDPHCKTFDGQQLSFQSNCSHIFARDGCLNGIPSITPTFEVTIDVEQHPYRTDRATVRTVHVNILGELECSFGQAQIISCTGSLANMFTISSTASFTITNENGTIVFRGVIEEGRWFEVRWDGDRYVAVDVPAAFEGKTCGICMNYDGLCDRRQGKLVLGPKAESFDKVIGEQTHDHNLAAYSWATNGSCPSSY